MENESRKSRNKTLQKVLLAVLSIILMTGIAFFMANVVHNNSSQPTSSKVKNGLSAYELAVEQGYKGDLNDWLKSLDGKSAFEIAKENGYSGTEKEWNKAVANVSKQNKSVITNAGFNKNGDFILTLLDGTDVNVSNVSNSKGKDGKNGTNGKNGKNGANGKDGRSITLASVNSEGQLVITYSDGSSVNLDKLVGINGIDGKDGTDGKDGVGINTVNITGDGKLNITLTNGTTLNLGTIKGEKGEKGDKGDTGRGIAKTELVNGELIITYTDGTKENLGSVSNAESEYSSGLQYTLNEDNNSYTLSSAGELFNSTKVVIPETYKGKPVTKIGERAFYSTQLYGSDSSKGAPINELILPSTIKSIALEAFYNCKIEKVVFEGTIEEWCSIQFIGISANPLYHPDNAKDNTKLYIDGELIETLVIPNSVSTISSYSFVDCGSLKEVVIPESVTSIEPHAFKNCGSLSSVEVKAPRGWYYKNGGYKYSISESTMSNKTLLAQKFVEGNPSNYYKN